MKLIEVTYIPINILHTLLNFNYNNYEVVAKHYIQPVKANIMQFEICVN